MHGDETPPARNETARYTIRPSSSGRTMRYPGRVQMSTSRKTASSARARMDASEWPKAVILVVTGILCSYGIVIIL
jgi:hypothetical protein